MGGGRDFLNTKEIYHSVSDIIAHVRMDAINKTIEQYFSLLKRRS